MSKKRVGTPDEQVDEVLCELQFYAFAACKCIAEIRGELSGTMVCPMCGRNLRFSTAPSNGHFAVKCSREGCLSEME